MTNWQTWPSCEKVQGVPECILDVFNTLYYIISQKVCHDCNLNLNLNLFLFDIQFTNAHQIPQSLKNKKLKWEGKWQIGGEWWWIYGSVANPLISSYKLSFSRTISSAKRYIQHIISYNSKVPLQARIAWTLTQIHFFILKNQLLFTVRLPITRWKSRKIPTTSTSQESRRA